MSCVQTYVFLDLETTGLPKEEYNKTRITELSLVAVKRQHLLDTRAGATPRVEHKLTLCLNPLRLISPSCTAVTGLDNDLLEHEPNFNQQVFSMIDTFLSVLSQPVCLIAQNGNAFDYPILKNHLVKLKVNFSAEVLCADCFHCFYHVLEKKKLDQQIYSTNIYTIKEQEATTTIADLDIRKVQEIEASASDAKVITPSKSSVDEIDFQTSNISMKSINETTPKTTKNIKAPKATVKARRKLFPWGDAPKPTDSYKLSKIYERVLNKKAIDCHRAENDCMFALEISVALSKQFVDWVDENHMKFSDVVPMTIGVPM